MAILAGKIEGETKLALYSHHFDTEQNKMMIGKVIAETAPFPTKKYEIRGENGKILNIKAMLEDFLNQVYYGRENSFGEGIEKNILGACFGIASNIEGDKDNKKVRIFRPALDLNVTFSESDFKMQLPCPDVPVAFINDMVAIGKSFLGQKEAQLNVLYQGTKQADTKERKVIMLVGEGLGQALWYWDEKNERLEPVSSEGGHTLFAPRTKREYELGLYLLENCPPKSSNGISVPIYYEYVLSAPGLVRIYEFLKSRGEYGSESSELRQILEQNNTDPAPIIDKATKDSDSLSIAALNLFIEIMGARAGDLALTYEAKGGIYINNFIDFENLPNSQLIFRDAFLDKENKFRQYNEEISVYVYQQKDSVLLGSACYAVDNGFVTKGKFAYKRMNR